MNLMAASITERLAGVYTPASAVPAVHPDRPRHITYKAARALEIIGHAIEYLSDEYFRDESLVLLDRAHLEAVQILLFVNHEIYFACPPVLTLRERWRLLLHLHGD